MFLVVLVSVLILVCIVSAIIYSNHNLRRSWQEANNMDVRLLREAVEYSQRGSNMSNAMLALVEVTCAKRTMETLIRRYGIQRADEITGQDTAMILDTITRQQDRIMKDITKNHPSMIPRGELKAYQGYVQERELSREDQVAHLDNFELQLPDFVNGK